MAQRTTNLTDTPMICRALSYANRCYVRPDAPEAGFDLLKELKAEGFFGEGMTKAIIVSGQQPGVIGTTDTIKVRAIE